MVKFGTSECTFFNILKNICLQDVSSEISLVNIAHMKDYVEASEASKDLAPHTLSRVEIWNWIILEHYEQLGSK